MNSKGREKISIIIPVYNTSEFLDQCIASVLNQTHKDIEVFLIDDGSTDSSSEIIKKHSLQDSRIKVYYQINGGQGSARNIGLNNATGEYIFFVDSDDWIPENACENLLREAELSESDLLCFNYTLYYPEKIRSVSKSNESVIWKGEEGLMAFFNDKISGHACNKFYRRDLIEKNRLRFINEKMIYEDLLFTIQVLSFSKTVKYIPESYYYYRIRPVSTTQEFNPMQIDQLKALERAEKFLIGQNKYIQFNSGFDRLFSVGYLDVLTRSFNSGVSSNEFYSGLEKWRSRVSLKHLDTKYKLIFLFSRIDFRLARFVYIKLIKGIYSKLISHK